MKRITAIVVCIAPSVIFCMSGCGTRVQDDTYDGPSISVARIDAPPDIDGNLDDACWGMLDSSMLVRAADGSDPKLATTVRFCCDDSCLYAGFECQDPDAVATVTAHDGPVFGGDHVALYIDADGDRNTYAVIEVAPNGIVRDAFVLCYHDGEQRMFLADWQCRSIRPAVTIYGGTAEAGTDDRFWTVELAIPFSSFVTAPNLPPRSGDLWLANAYRAETSGTREYTALAPTGDDGFHHPRSFVRFVFDERGSD